MRACAYRGNYGLRRLVGNGADSALGVGETDPFNA